MIPEIGAEVDRQLNDQRSAADSLATRSGLLIAANAAILGIAATQQATQAVSPTGFWLIGASLLLGVAVFWMSRVSIGPSPSQIALASSGQVLTEAKLILVEANNRLLARTQAIFTLQVIMSFLGLTALVGNLWPMP